MNAQQIAKEKIEAKFQAMNHNDLFEVLRGLNNDDREEAFVLMNIAIDAYMAKVPEETFTQAMDILDSEMDY